MRDGDALDADARERGTSVYFPRRVIPMLPEALSNELCSLKPDVDRLCMACDMRIDARGAIKRYAFYPGGDAFARAPHLQRGLARGSSDPAAAKARGAARCCRTSRDLYALYKVLLASARASAARSTSTPSSSRSSSTSTARSTRIVPAPRNDAHKLIEECMLAANVCAADFLAAHEQPALYRDARRPAAREARGAARVPRGLGADARRRRRADGDGLREADRRASASRPDFALLQTVLLRSLSQAQYSPDNVGHFGLAYDAYAHFTSPIRRYPDLLVHRAIKAVLAGTRYTPPDASWAELGVHCSMTERRADDATRDVRQWLKCYYMQDQVGESFAGTISGVTSFGIFVTLDGLDIDGLVHVTELARDYFHFDGCATRSIGERSGARVPARGPRDGEGGARRPRAGEDRLHARRGGGARRGRAAIARARAAGVRRAARARRASARAQDAPLAHARRRRRPRRAGAAGAARGARAAAR